MKPAPALGPPPADRGAEDANRLVTLVRRCGTSPVSAESGANEERETAKLLSASTLSHRLRTSLSVKIPVQYHVVAMEDGTGDVPDSWIDAQTALLNRIFGAHRIQFEHIGTDRIRRSEWHRITAGSSTEGDMVRHFRKPESKPALHIYLGEPKDRDGKALLGYALYPWDALVAPDQDHVAIHYQSLPGGGFVSYDLGMTAVHEVGHWLGLYHTFEGGCSGTGDRVADTPPEAEETTKCDLTRDTCPGDRFRDSVTNYMNYAPDHCMTEFTAGQVIRMQQQVAIHRRGFCSLAHEVDADLNQLFAPINR